MNITSDNDFTKNAILGIDIGAKFITLTKCESEDKHIKTTIIETDLSEKHWLYILTYLFVETVYAF